MIQPPFPSTIGVQQRQFTCLTTKTAARKNGGNGGQMGSRAWTRQCLRGIKPHQFNCLSNMLCTLGMKYNESIRHYLATEVQRQQPASWWLLYVYKYS